MSPSDNDSLSSSLPKSLRQHLYTGPRRTHPLDAPRPSLPPLVPPPLPVAAAAARSRLLLPSSASLLDLAGEAVHQTTIPTPRHSDPVFHAPRSSRSILHSPSPEDPYGGRHSWREGEAGPSRSREAPSWRLQPKNEPVPYFIPREEIPWLQNNRVTWSEADPRSPFPHHPTPRPREPIVWVGQDANLTPFDHRMGSPFVETQSNPEFQRPFSSPSPHQIATSHSVPPGFHASQFQTKHYPQRELSSSTINNYTLPPPPSTSPSPSVLQSSASPRPPSFFSDLHLPNPTHSDASSQHLTQKRTKTPVACEFCRGRKLKCDGDKPRCKNCYERRFECKYPTFQRRRGPGKAPKGSRARKRAVAVASTSGSVASTLAGNEAKPGYRTQAASPDRSSHELAPEVRPYTSVINLDRYTFEPPAEAPQYPPLRPQRPPESRRWTPRSRETSSEDRSDAEEINRNK